jgi:exopolysaccharide production protein ExoZ
MAFGNGGVDLFFVISGFVMAYTMARYAGQPVGFLGNRFWRIAPLAYLVAFAWAALEITFNLDPGRPITGGNLASAMTFIPFTSQYDFPQPRVLWTLSFEFTFYTLVALCCAVRRGPGLLLGLTAMLGIAGLFWVSTVPLLRWFTNPILLEFAAGVTAFLLWERVSPRLLIVSALSGSLLFITYLLVGTPRVDANPGGLVSGSTVVVRLIYWGLPAFLIFSAVIAMRPTGTGAVVLSLKKLGDASYSLYLTHLFAIDGARALGLGWPIAVLSAVVLGLAVYRWVEAPLLSMRNWRPSLYRPSYIRE